MKSLITLIFLILSLFLLPMNMQDQTDQPALIVIDIQDFYFPGGDMPLVNPEEAARNAAKLLDHFRENGQPIIFIKHNHEPGGAINELVAPEDGEQIFTKDNVNSFLETGLDEYLKKLGVKSLVICGMQTHMCLEAATRAAADLDYNCTVIHDACATRDLKFGDKTIKAEDVHYATLSTLQSYAKVVSTEEYLSK